MSSNLCPQTFDALLCVLARGRTGECVHNRLVFCERLFHPAARLQLRGLIQHCCRLLLSWKPLIHLWQRPCPLTEEQNKNPIGRGGKNKNRCGKPCCGKKFQRTPKQHGHHACHHAMCKHHQKNKPTSSPGTPESRARLVPAAVSRRFRRWLDFAALPARIELVINLFAACLTFPHSPNSLSQLP